MVLELLNNITPNKYIHSIIILVVFFVMSELMVFLSQKIFLKITKKTKTKIDDLIVAKTNRPISFIIILVGLRLAIIPHPIRPDILNLIEHVISTLIIAVVTYIVTIIFDILISNWGHKFASGNSNLMISNFSSKIRFCPFKQFFMPIQNNLQ